MDDQTAIITLLTMFSLKTRNLQKIEIMFFPRSRGVATSLMLGFKSVRGQLLPCRILAESVMITYLSCGPYLRRASASTRGVVNEPTLPFALALTLFEGKQDRQ